jgi:hypothetical protein
LNNTLVTSSFPQPARQIRSSFSQVSTANLAPSSSSADCVNQATWQIKWQINLRLEGIKKGDQNDQANFFHTDRGNVPVFKR